MRTFACLMTLSILVGCGTYTLPHAAGVNLRTVGAKSSAAKAHAEALPLKSAAGIKAAGQRVSDAFFASNDHDGDGRLGRDEFSGFSLPDVSLTLTFEQIDANRDGFVTPDELSAVVESPLFVHAYQVVYAAEFRQYDVDRDGYMSNSEFQGVLAGGGIGQYMTPSSFFDADVDGDGALNPSEYEDLSFGTYVDFVLVPFIQGGGTGSRHSAEGLGRVRVPLTLPRFRRHG
jgi:Ca2+-binding EF-hand superfamily protein